MPQQPGHLIGPLPEGRVGEAPPFVGQGLAVRGTPDLLFDQAVQRGLGNSRFGTVERRDERTVPLRHDVLAGERMIRLIPITDELFEQDVVLLRQRLDEFAVEENRGYSSS